jgi:hypothetical protein
MNLQLNKTGKGINSNKIYLEKKYKKNIFGAQVGGRGIHLTDLCLRLVDLLSMSRAEKASKSSC